MNALDVGIVAVIAGFAVYGIFRGLVRLVLGFLSVALGIMMAAWLSAPLAETFQGLVRSPSGRRLAAAVILFFATVLACAGLAWLIRRALKPANLLWADRAAGAVAGASMGVLLVASALVPLTALLPEESRLVGDSVVAPHIMSVSALLRRAVPEELKQKYDAARERLRRAGEDSLPEGVEVPDAETLQKGLERMKGAQDPQKQDGAEKDGG